MHQFHLFSIVVITNLLLLPIKSIHESFDLASWKFQVKETIDKEFQKNEMKCENQEGDSDFWLKELERFPLYDQFIKIDSLAQKNYKAVEDIKIKVVHSIIYGYDTEYLPSVKIYFLGKDFIKAYKLNRAGKFSVIKDGAKYLKFYNELESGCDFNLFVISDFEKDMHLSSLKTIINTERIIQFSN